MIMIFVNHDYDFCESVTSLTPLKQESWGLFGTNDAGRVCVCVCFSEEEKSEKKTPIQL